MLIFVVAIKINSFQLNYNALHEKINALHEKLTQKFGKAKINCSILAKTGEYDILRLES
jgi:hypothetical protein